MAFGLQKVLPQLSQQFFIVRPLWNSAQPRVITGKRAIKQKPTVLVVVVVVVVVVVL